MVGISLGSPGRRTGLPGFSSPRSGGDSFERTLVKVSKRDLSLLLCHLIKSLTSPSICPGKPSQTWALLKTDQFLEDSYPEPTCRTGSQTAKDPSTLA